MAFDRPTYWQGKAEAAAAYEPLPAAYVPSPRNDDLLLPNGYGVKNPCMGRGANRPKGVTATQNIRTVGTARSAAVYCLAGIQAELWKESPDVLDIERLSCILDDMVTLGRGNMSWQAFTKYLNTRARLKTVQLYGKRFAYSPSGVWARTAARKRIS